MSENYFKLLKVCKNNRKWLRQSKKNVRKWIKKCKNVRFFWNWNDFKIMIIIRHADFNELFRFSKFQIFSGIMLYSVHGNFLIFLDPFSDPFSDIYTHGSIFWHFTYNRWRAKADEKPYVRKAISRSSGKNWTRTKLYCD